VTGAVVVRELRRSFATTTAVDGASWSAGAGTVTALLGRNGAGKTTTVECLEGLQRPDAGSVQVLGVDPWHAGPDHRARVGVMLQEGGLPTSSRPLALLRHLAALYADPAPLDELVERRGIGIEGGEVAQECQRSAAGRQPALLEHHPDPGPVVGPRVPRVDAEHLHRPGIRPLQPFEALDRRGLSGAVPPEQRGDRTCAGRPARAVDGGGRRERPAQLAHHDCTGHGSTS